MCMSSPKAPAPPPPPPPPPATATPPTKANKAVKTARSQAQTRARGLQGDKSTQLTGPRGIMAPAQTAGTTLLGG